MGRFVLFGSDGIYCSKSIHHICPLRYGWLIFGEVSSSNFLFGLVVVWLLDKPFFGGKGEYREVMCQSAENPFLELWKRKTLTLLFVWFIHPVLLTNFIIQVL